MSIGVCLLKTGKFKEVIYDVKSSKKWSEFIGDYIKNQGYNLYTDCGLNDKQNEIILLARKEGKPRNVNKHELPPPLDTVLFYDDIYVFKTKNLLPVSLTIYEFKNLYVKAFKGFESILYSDDERSVDSSMGGSIEDFIVDDDDEQYEYSSDYTSEGSV